MSKPKIFVNLNPNSHGARLALFSQNSPWTSMKMLEFNIDLKTKVA